MIRLIQTMNWQGSEYESGQPRTKVNEGLFLVFGEKILNGLSFGPQRLILVRRAGTESRRDYLLQIIYGLDLPERKRKERLVSKSNGNMSYDIDIFPFELTYFFL